LTSASSDSGTRGASAFASFVPFVASFVAALEGGVEVLEGGVEVLAAGEAEALAAGEAEALAEGEAVGSFRLASSLSGWTLAAHPAVRTARPPSRRVRRVGGAEGLTVLERALEEGENIGELLESSPRWARGTRGGCVVVFVIVVVRAGQTRLRNRKAGRCLGRALPLGRSARMNQR